MFGGTPMGISCPVACPFFPNPGGGNDEGALGIRGRVCTVSCNRFSQHTVGPGRIVRVRGDSSGPGWQKLANTIGASAHRVLIRIVLVDILIAIVIVVIAAVLGIVVHPVLWVIIIAAVLWLFFRRGRW